MSRLIKLSCLILFGYSANCFTQGSIEEVVITSSRVPMPIRQIGTSMSVITAEDIERRQSNFLTDILRSQTSITINNAGGAGKATAVSIRGEEGYRTLVRLDGINISDTSGPQVSPRMGQLLSSGVTRVEILRGPQGLLYGADAGGVINISTIKNTDELTGAISIETGSYDTNQKAANLSGGSDIIDFFLSGAKIQTRGFNSRTSDTSLRDDDGYKNETVHGKISTAPVDGLRLDFIFHNVDAENEYDNCYTASFSVSNDCDDFFSQEAWRVSANYELENFDHEFSYNSSETDRVFFTEDIAGFSPQGELKQYGYLGSYMPKTSTRFVYGIEHKKESMNDGTYNSSRDQNGYFFEYQQDFSSKLFLTGGIRHDDNDDFGSHNSARVSVAYLIPYKTGELKLKSTLGTGFRPPSLFEIAYNSRQGVYPPAADVTLREERSEGFDLGVGWLSKNGLRANLVYFDQSIENEIYFDNVAWSGYLQGAGESESRGIEFDFGWIIIPNLDISSNYTNNRAETSTGNTRALRPKHLANINVAWNSPGEKLAINLNYRHVGKTRGPYGIDIDSYNLVEMSSSWSITKSFTVFARIENMTDESFVSIPGYNIPEASAYLGFRYEI